MVIDDQNLLLKLKFTPDIVIFIHFISSLVYFWNTYGRFTVDMSYNTYRHLYCSFTGLLVVRNVFIQVRIQRTQTQVLIPVSQTSSLIESFPAIYTKKWDSFQSCREIQHERGCISNGLALSLNQNIFLGTQERKEHKVPICWS